MERLICKSSKEDPWANQVARSVQVDYKERRGNETIEAVIPYAVLKAHPVRDSEPKKHVPNTTFQRLQCTSHADDTNQIIIYTIQGKTIEQHRDDLGELFLANNSVYRFINPSTAIETIMHPMVFRLLVMPNAAVVSPANWNIKTLVVTAQVRGVEAMAEVFGYSNIHSPRTHQIHACYAADRADIVYFPATRKFRAWWTMR